MAKFCTNCGAELNEEQDICLKCGVRINKTNSTNPANSDPNAKSKIAPLLNLIEINSLLFITLFIPS